MTDIAKILSDSAKLHALLATKAALNGDSGAAEAHARRSRMAYVFQQSVEANRAKPSPRRAASNVVTLKFN